MRSPIKIILALAVILATATATAQVYKWVDKDGQVQYSDLPPPPGVAKVDPKKISSAAATSAAASVPAAAAAAPAKPGEAAKVADPAKIAKDKNKEVEKRRIEAIEKTKKEDDLAKVAQADSERCKAATANLREYESGRPIYRTGENGDRTFVPEEVRAAETTRIRAAMTESCK